MVETKTLTPAAQFHESFQKMSSQFELALPKHMPVERFMRVVQTAVNGNPDLLVADRASLFEACMKAAQDGLLPDGRDGALVIYNTKVPGKDGEKDRWIKKVQWMPMVGGIMKKARNSGEIALITAGCVWGGDKFRYWIDDDGEHIFYEPGEKQDLNIFVCAFAMAKLKDGTVYALKVTPTDVDKMRNASKAKDGPAWKVWFDQMAMKGAIRRLSKRLPMSSDLDDLVRRDDELYDFKGEREEFQRIENPLRDRPPAPKTIEHSPDETTETDTSTAESDGDDELDAELIIDRQGNVTKRPADGTVTPATVLDYRFPDEPLFDSFQLWLTNVESNKLANPLAKDTKPARSAGTSAAGGGEAAESDSGTGEAEGPATTETSQAASPSPAKAQSEAKAAKQAPAKPYTDGGTYFEWLKGQLGTAKSKAGIQDVWGSSKADRLELCSAEQMEELADLKNAALERVAKGK